MAIGLVLQSSATIAQPTGDLVIHNGLIINATGRMQADIRISGEKIVEIARRPWPLRARAIDASGKFLMPGIIDMHTHNWPPLDSSRQAVGRSKSGAKGRVQAGFLEERAFYCCRSQRPARQGIEPCVRDT